MTVLIEDQEGYLMCLIFQAQRILAETRHSPQGTSPSFLSKTNDPSCNWRQPVDALIDNETVQ